MMNFFFTRIDCFLSGIVIGIIIIVVASAFVIEGETYTDARRAIEECERTLPRNEHCVASAKVADNKDL